METEREGERERGGRDRATERERRGGREGEREGGERGREGEGGWWMVRDEEDAVLPAMPIGGWSGAPKKAWCYQHTGRGCQRERGREREGEKGRGAERSGGEVGWGGRGGEGREGAREGGRDNSMH